MDLTIHTAISAGTETSSMKMKNGNTIFAGDLKLNDNETADLIAQKRGSAQKQAMKLIGDAWDKDNRRVRKISDLQKMKSDRVSELQTYESRLQDISVRKAEIQEEYGIDSDSQEQKDLELLEKFQDYKNGSLEEAFSKEEIARLEQLQDMPRTEYQDKVLAENAAAGVIKQQARQKEMEMMTISQSISTVKDEQLRSQDMLNAEDVSDEIKAAAEDEIMGILVQDGVNHIDEAKKEEEEAEKKAEEEKEKQQEKTDKKQEERKEQEDILKGVAESDKMDQEAALQQQTTTNVAQAQKNIQKMLQENNLVNEDLKGIEIDFNF